MAHAPISEGVGKHRGDSLDGWHGEKGWGRGGGFKHIGDAGSRVVGVGSAQRCKELLGIVIKSGITAQFRARSSCRALPRQEPNHLVTLGGFKLVRQAQKNMRWHIVRTETRKVGILLVLLLLECRARPGFMNDATAAVPAERAVARALSEVFEPLAS